MRDDTGHWSIPVTALEALGYEVRAEGEQSGPSSPSAIGVECALPDEAPVSSGASVEFVASAQDRLDEVTELRLEEVRD